ncbi:MAG TPA: hypothetical protein VMI75_37250 [Polyangiaceae bacterium]|nr:hypothetical protein [Polyangiaceae bacterium]
MAIAVRDTIIRLAAPASVDRWISIIAGVATVVAAIAAIWGLRAWRKQLRGSTKYRLVLRLNRAVIRFRDRVRSAREPFNNMVPIYEGETGSNTPVFVERERKIYWGYFQEALSATIALREVRPDAEILLGSQATALIDRLAQVAQKLDRGYRAYFEFRARAAAGDQQYTHHADSLKPVIFNLSAISEGKDEFGSEFEATVTETLAFLEGQVQDALK